MGLPLLLFHGPLALASLGLAYFLLGLAHFFGLGYYDLFLDLNTHKPNLKTKLRIHMKKKNIILSINANMTLCDP